MRNIVNVVLIMVLLALLLGLLLAVDAETDRPNERRPTEGIDIELSREEIPRLVEIIRIWKLADELKLEEKQLVEFLPRFKELNDLRSNYFRDRREVLGKMRKLLEANPSEGQLKSALNDLRNAEVKFLQKERQLEEALNSGLTVEQQVKFIVFQDVYRRDMQRLMRNLQELSSLRERRLRAQPVPLKENK